MKAIHKSYTKHKYIVMSPITQIYDNAKGSSEELPFEKKGKKK